MTNINNLLLPGDLPEGVIHGDPKISNFLYDKDDIAVAFVDLDTCARSTVLFDLGDAFRSWCGLEEHNPENTFNVEYLESGLRGYFSENNITSEEKELITQSIELITLELATRFCADYFADTYFGYDKESFSSRREHNLARTRGQIALHKSFIEQKDEIKKIIQSL